MTRPRRSSHPGIPGDRRAVQSVAVHLILLHLVLEDGVDPMRRHVLLKRIVRSRAFSRLEPPTLRGRMTAADVLLRGGGPDEHRASILGWADDLWAAWSSHHATIRSWVRKGLGDEPANR